MDQNGNQKNLLKPAEASTINVVPFGTFAGNSLSKDELMARTKAYRLSLAKKIEQ